MSATSHATPPRVRPAETPSDWVRTIIVAVLIALTFRGLVLDPFNIPSGSMKPGLQVGDFLFVSKYSYGYSSLVQSFGLLPFKGRIGGHAPERGDVVVFKLPTDDSFFKETYIKRLIGLPGDVVQVKSAIVYINGKPMPRERVGLIMDVERDGLPMRPATLYKETFDNGNSHTIMQMTDDGMLDNWGPFTVPAEHYFCMGDNRNNSTDSRVQARVGFVPAENLVGKARFTFLSLTEDASFWQFWKWPFSIRWDRMFKTIE